MKEFLSEYGLYKSYRLHEEYTVGEKNYVVPHDFEGETFQYYCDNEGENRTFEIEIENSTKEYYNIGMDIPSDFIVDNRLNYTFKAVCKCRSCKTYHVDFLLHIYSDDIIPKKLIKGLNLQRRGVQNPTNNEPKKKPSIYVKKVGAIPEIVIVPNKIIANYFDRESNNWYFKGINALNKNFGVGSLAYFRKIIEKELIHIVESIKLLPDSHSSEIEKLLKEHSKNPKVSTIYDNIFQYLPSSLRSLGDNPIKLLYNQTSEGLHSLSEKECIVKSEQILKLLEFIIKKINEERSEIKDLKETIKGLK
jgi:hypothetical protein